MKYTITLLLITLGMVAHAQYAIGHKTVAYDTTMNNGKSVILLMDIAYPIGATNCTTFQDHHAGGGIGGDRSNGKNDALVSYFVPKGFVVTSDEYRLQSKDFMHDPTKAPIGLYLAVVDVRNSFNYITSPSFKNTYHTNGIVIPVGESYGAILADCESYWDAGEVLGTPTPEALPPINKTLIKFVTSCWGGLPILDCLNGETIPFTSYHCIGDGTVPFNCNPTQFGIYMCGDNSINNYFLSHTIKTQINNTQDISIWNHARHGTSDAKFAQQVCPSILNFNNTIH